jgi:hypothetical protein
MCMVVCQPVPAVCLCHCVAEAPDVYTDDLASSAFPHHPLAMNGISVDWALPSAAVGTLARLVLCLQLVCHAGCKREHLQISV